MDPYLTAHPEVHAAVAFGLEALAKARPANPFVFFAEKLREFSGANRDGSDQRPGVTASAAGAGAPDADADEAAEDRRRMDMQRRMKRRSNVFSEPVKLDKSWKPQVIPKTAEQKQELHAVLRKNILFAGMEDSQRDVIADAMEEKRFASGELIIKQGDPGDYYYVLASGKCDIFKDGALVLQCSKGMGFGELALMYDAPRAATVQATSDDVITWAIDRTTFKQVMIGTTQRRREIYEDFLEGVPILATLSKEEKLTVADALQSQSFEAGEEIVREGDTQADRFYIVEEGELKGTKAGVEGEVCPRLTRGAYFGEIALIIDQPRAATITAVTRTKCAVMDRAAFLRLIGPMKELLTRNMDLYAKYQGTLDLVAGGGTDAPTDEDADE